MSRMLAAKIAGAVSVLLKACCKNRLAGDTELSYSSRRVSNLCSQVPSLSRHRREFKEKVSIAAAKCHCRFPLSLTAVIALTSLDCRLLCLAALQYRQIAEILQNSIAEDSCRSQVRLPSLSQQCVDSLKLPRHCLADAKIPNCLAAECLECLALARRCCCCCIVPSHAQPLPLRS
eukprot:scaffold154062_cov43-Attheya_sp.AAC.1